MSCVRRGAPCISIHALREEGDLLYIELDTILRISIHALREEGDKLRSATLSSLSLFLSTPSARRATAGGPGSFHGRQISIHALREEGDEGPRTGRQAVRISIHALREEGDRRHR